MAGWLLVDYLVHKPEAKLMPRFSKSAFTFGPEFGACLRGLRQTRESAALTAKAFNTWKVTLQATEPKTARPAVSHRARLTTGRGRVQLLCGP